jgi:rhodanese-related sulfurtransferase
MDRALKPTNFIRLFLLATALAGYAHYCQRSRSHTAELPDPATVVGIPLLRMAEAEALWHEPGTLFLDVRSTSDFEFGHIAGAINIPEERLEKQFPAFRERLASARAIVVYCKSEDCGKSLWAAIRLRNEGLMQTKIYPAGWNQWSTSDLPVSRSHE